MSATLEVPSHSNIRCKVDCCLCSLLSESESNITTTFRRTFSQDAGGSQAGKMLSIIGVEEPEQIEAGDN